MKPPATQSSKAVPPKTVPLKTGPLKTVPLKTVPLKTVPLKTVGDDAVGKLLAEHRGDLRRWIDYRIDPRLQGRVDASDVVQDVCWEATRRYDHFLGHVGSSGARVPFWTWLESLARDRLIDLRRWHGRQKRAVEREAKAGGSTGSKRELELPSDQSSPSWVAIRQERKTILQAALGQLDPHDREILELREFQSLCNRDIARRLGLSEAAASARYIRALSRLGRSLDPGALQ